MARQNYFNTLTMAQKLDQLGRCRFMDRSEFNGVEKLRGKKVVIVGCGAQGLNQGLNMRDSGLDVSYALRADAIAQKRVSYTNATSNGFKVGTYEELIPTADLVCNLAPDKQHADVVQKVMPLMKKGACLAYSHGFNIVEEGQQIFRSGRHNRDRDIEIPRCLSSKRNVLAFLGEVLPASYTECHSTDICKVVASQEGNCGAVQTTGHSDVNRWTRRHRPDSAESLIQCTMDPVDPCAIPLIRSGQLIKGQVCVASQRQRLHGGVREYCVPGWYGKCVVYPVATPKKLDQIVG